MEKTLKINENCQLFAKKTNTQRKWRYFWKGRPVSVVFLNESIDKTIESIQNDKSLKEMHECYISRSRSKEIGLQHCLHFFQDIEEERIKAGVCSFNSFTFRFKVYSLVSRNCIGLLDATASNDKVTFWIFKE